jgi:hypothetical protein
MFREILTKAIRSDITAALQSDKILRAAQAIGADDVGWESLTAPQRELRRLKRFASSVKTLSELECAEILSQEARIDPKAVEIVSILASLDKPNAANPTRLQLLDVVAQRVREGRPLEMFASLCLEKGAGLRDGKLSWFLDGKRRETPEVLATTASIKGWGSVKKILEKVEYPVRVTFLLGDLDYAVVDGCGAWCEPGWEAILNKDTDRILKETKEQADAFFGSGRGVQVRKWSSFYAANEIVAELPRAETLVTPDKSPCIIKSSFEMYKRQWGYSALARKMDISEEALNAFIIGDVQRMAAQYRVEANYVQLFNGIQLWCEAVPNPGWPLELSNFTRSGYVPSLIMD